MRTGLFNHDLPGMLICLLVEAGLAFWLIDWLLDGPVRMVVMILAIFAYATVVMSGTDPLTWRWCRPRLRARLLHHRDLVQVAEQDGDGSHRAWVDDCRGGHVTVRPEHDPLRLETVPIARVVRIVGTAGGGGA